MPTPASQHIIFAVDITGSVALHQRVDELEAQRVLERCLTRIERSIQAHDGEILEQQGDELLGRCDGADNALRAALEMQARIADLPPVSGHKLSIRVALLGAGDEGQQSPLSTDLRNATLGLIAQAQADQLVCCARLAQTFADSKEVSCFVLPRPATQSAPSGSEEVFLLQALTAHSIAKVPGANHQPAVVARLCVRHRGKAFLIDERTPILSIGRDAQCGLQIEDRKVSRHHARIERRADGYFMVDTSTNGSFLTLDGRPEILVRQDESLLQGSGQICFGGSANDWAAERIDFEGM